MNGTNRRRHDRKNIGARDAESTEYDREAADDARKAVVDQQARDLARRSVEDAQEWIDNRGNAGDNIPTSTVRSLHEALRAENDSEALRLALDVSGRPMHPTANDIVGGAARQVVYSLTGRRAHRFEVSGDD
jgi:hypothetical protein